MRVPTSNAPDGYERAVSDAESRRFGRRVTRYTLVGSDPSSLCERIRQDDPDLAIVRFPAGQLDIVPEFEKITPRVVFCDCLAVWQRGDLRAGSIPPAPRDGALRIREGVGEDRRTLERLAPEIFANYRNHWSFNPSLQAFDLREAYAEWALAYLSTVGRACLIAEWEGDACAFLTLEHGHDDALIVLNGVLPRYRSRGVYGALVQSALRLAAERGARAMTVSTQVENVAVQRVWARLQFLPIRAYHTVHLNLGDVEDNGG